MVAKSQKASNADNVKARVLHVMNMNHTKRKLSTCSKETRRQNCRPWTLPFSNKQNQKEVTQKEETKKFQEVGWNLKDQKDSEKETSKRLTKHHEPPGKARKYKTGRCQSIESEVNQ